MNLQSDRYTLSPTCAWISEHKSTVRASTPVDTLYILFICFSVVVTHSVQPVIPARRCGTMLFSLILNAEFIRNQPHQPQCDLRSVASFSASIHSQQNSAWQLPQVQYEQADRRPRTPSAAPLPAEHTRRTRHHAVVCSCSRSRFHIAFYHFFVECFVSPQFTLTLRSSLLLSIACACLTLVFVWNSLANKNEKALRPLCCWTRVL